MVTFCVARNRLWALLALLGTPGPDARLKGIMAIFAVIPQPSPNSPKLGPVIVEKFPTQSLTLDGNAGWLLAANSTAQDLSTLLGVTDDSNGAAVIVEIAAYFGRANPNIWSWIKANWDSPKNG